MVQLMAPTVVFKEDESLQKLRIGLELYVSNIRDEWILMLRIPRFRNEALSVGRNDVAFVGRGMAQPSQLPLKRLENGPVTYDVLPTTEPLGILSFTESVILAARQQFQPMSIRLPADRCAVFHATGLTYMRGIGSQLYWNTNYFLVWSEALPLTIPRGLLTKELRTSNGWNCALISLPDKPNEADRLWLLHYTGYDVASRSVAVTLVMPTFSVQEDSSIKTRWQGDLALSIRRLNDEILHEPITVETKQGDQKIDTRDSRAMNLLVAQQEEDEAFYIRYGNEPGILITTSVTLQCGEPCGVFLSGTDERGRRITVPFESIKAHEVLTGSRAKRGRLDAIRARGSFDGSVRYRGIDEFVWLKGTITERIADAGKLGVIEVPQLDEHLTEGESEIVIRMGPALSQHIGARPRRDRGPELIPEPSFVRTQNMVTSTSIRSRYNRTGTSVQHGSEKTDSLISFRRYASHGGSSRRIA